MIGSPCIYPEKGKSSRAGEHGDPTPHYGDFDGVLNCGKEGAEPSTQGFGPM
jgi:hypothetical protein